MLDKIMSFFDDLKGYNASKFQQDVSAGLVTGVISIPLSLALAIATGVPPIWGLYTAAVAGFFAGFFAGSRYSVSGPAAAIVPILTSIINEFGLEVLPIITFFTGLLLIVFGFLKVGTFVKYVPATVMIGFTAGVAFLIFFGQLEPFLGLTDVVKHEHFHEKFLALFEALHTFDIYTIIIGLLALSILIIMPKIQSLNKVPPSIVAVVVCTTIASSFPVFSEVTTIAEKYGDIVAGFPPFVNPFQNFESGDISIYFTQAIKLAFLIAVESLLCAVVADKLTKTKHKPNTELVGQGIANMVTPFFTGIPATAVIARTGTSIKNGAQTRIASIVHALVVLIFIVFLASLGGKIPLTVLSAVLFITAWKISEIKEIKHIFAKAPKSEVFILSTTLLLTVFTDLIIAVSAGLLFSVLIIFKNLSTIDVEDVGEAKNYMSDNVKNFLEKHKDLKFLNIEGNMTMGIGDSLRGSCGNLIKDTTKVVVMRLKNIHHIDLSGLEALEEFVKELREKKIKVFFIVSNKHFIEKIERYEILKHVNGTFKATEDMLRNYK